MEVLLRAGECLKNASEEWCDDTSKIQDLHSSLQGQQLPSLKPRSANFVVSCLHLCLRLTRWRQQWRPERAS